MLDFKAFDPSNDSLSSRKKCLRATNKKKTFYSVSGSLSAREKKNVPEQPIRRKHLFSIIGNSVRMIKCRYRCVPYFAENFQTCWCFKLYKFRRTRRIFVVHFTNHRYLYSWNKMFLLVHMEYICAMTVESQYVRFFISIILHFSNTLFRLVVFSTRITPTQTILKMFPQLFLHSQWSFLEYSVH